MKKYIFLFCILFFSTLSPASKINCDLEHFLQVIKSAESFYQQQDDEKFIKSNLLEKLKVRDELYEFRTQFDVYLNKCQTSNEIFDPKEYEMVFNQLLPLLKEVVRHLEDHLEKQHGWEKPRHFSRIAKPLVLTSTAMISLIALTKILEKTGTIPPDVSQNVCAGIGVGGVGFLGLWIAYNYYNYRDVMARKLIRKA